MSSQDYLWYLAFDDPSSYEYIYRTLDALGVPLEGSTTANLLCPDGEKRPSITCQYEVIRRVREIDRKKGCELKLLFYILRSTPPGGALEFWPPGNRSAYLSALSRRKKPSKVIQSAQDLLRSMQEPSKPTSPGRKSAEKTDPYPFD